MIAAPITKTLKDCAGCPKVSRRNAHITDGTHQHQDSGCQPILDADECNEALVMVRRLHSRQART